MKIQSNINDEFVPYTEMLNLKTIGFDEPCIGWWSITTPHLIMIEHVFPEEFKEDILLASTFSQAFRWFRKKYGLIGLVRKDTNRNYNGWWFEILSQVREEDNPTTLYCEDFNQDTYEEAELECIKKLIEIVKLKQ